MIHLSPNLEFVWFDLRTFFILKGEELAPFLYRIRGDHGIYIKDGMMAHVLIKEELNDYYLSPVLQ